MIVQHTRTIVAPRTLRGEQTKAIILTKRGTMTYRFGSETERDEYLAREYDFATRHKLDWAILSFI